MITKHANACIYFDERAITAWVARSTFDAEQRLTACERIYRRIYELPERLVQPGAPFTEIVHHFLEKEAGVAHHELLDARELIARHLEQLALGKSPVHIHFLRDGRVIVVRNQLLPKGGWAEVHEDITDKCRAEAQILHLSGHDDPTSNRTALDEHLRGALLRAARGARFARLFLGFDAFMAVNNRFGNRSGMTIFAKRSSPTNSS